MRATTTAILLVAFSPAWAADAPAIPPAAAPAPAVAPPAPGTAEAGKSDKVVFDTDDRNLIKKSRSDTCHDQFSPYFSATVHFKAYKTMQDCLDSGGRKLTPQR